MPGLNAGSKEDQLIRRLALWLLREALLSWVSLRPSPPQPFAPLSWISHLLRCAAGADVSKAPSPADGGQGAASARLPAWLRIAILQELRLLIAQVGGP
jgi:hypothetical protein